MTPRASKAPSIEDTMFFPRLRRHAKWMFFLLALFMGLGFVIFGVGAGGVGVGDLLRDGSGGSGASVGSALEKTEENPKDPEAWRELSTAYQTEGDTAAAIDALERAVNLQPKDADTYRELGALWLTRAAELQRQAQLVQLQAVFNGASTQFVPQLVTSKGTVGEDKIAQALEQQAGVRVQQLASQAQDASASAVSTYKELVAVTPDDPNVQLELAQAAEQANDATTAIAAYERFLKLAPDDSNASIVREQLKQLRG